MEDAEAVPPNLTFNSNRRVGWGPPLQLPWPYSLHTRLHAPPLPIVTPAGSAASTKHERGVGTFVALSCVSSVPDNPRRPGYAPPPAPPAFLSRSAPVRQRPITTLSTAH